MAGHDEGSPHVSFFAFANSYWAERSRENFLFVHYNDLQADLAGEMQRVADFLDIAVAPTVLPELAAAAGFDSMRRDSGQLLAVHDRVFRGGNDRFLYKAQNDRWRGVFDDQDLALYDARVNEAFPPAFTAWLARGRLQAGDPQGGLSSSPAALHEASDAPTSPRFARLTGELGKLSYGYHMLDSIH